MQGHKTTAVCPRTRTNLMRRRCFCAWTMCFKVGVPPRLSLGVSGCSHQLRSIAPKQLGAVMLSD